MTTVTIEVSSVETTKERMKAAFRGEPQGCFISFPSHEDLWATLTANRWAILKALTGAGPLGVRELARRIGRDVKGVHTDAQALVLCGVIDKSADGKLLFPYDLVHVEFMLKAA
ncbi:transcriptional regulator [uncultured Thiodictyon sp.]|jgi:predicted transcriptional regulator|uniref:HVO_A0114 family putative DNA-binding protein n=1 Tax=uncultured Thiodictyon sp. TaxID=1846217 RepID=UPI0025E146D5|nr:transcriptional regulator [uncultured Thiodictyon sp.]